MKIYKRYTLFSFLLILLLSSCTALFQNPVKVEDANQTSIPAGSTPAGTTVVTSTGNPDNPYSSYPTVSQTTGSAKNYQPTDTTTTANSTATANNINKHTVALGDTVYNISKRYGISQEDLIRWNHIIDNNIHLGQVLLIKDPSEITSASVLHNSPTTTNTTTATSIPEVPMNAPSNFGETKNYDGITWTLPTKGKIMKTFNSTNKGLDFSGNVGQDIIAAADGKVVYSGSGLKGYGNLLIIQHSPVYLTAYANNQRLLVKEGDKVVRGTKIATMGSSDSPVTKLHFELRKNGTPVDPSVFLP